MLLQELNEYADRLELPPHLYADAPVRYVIELDLNGKPRSRQPTDTADSTNPATRRGQRRPVPQIQRSSRIRPILLADHSEYTFGLQRDEERSGKRAADCHRAYLGLIEHCAEETKDPSVAAVLAFLRDDPITQLDIPPDFDRSATLTFRVDSTFPVDLPSVQRFWAESNEAPDRPKMQCLVCGETKPVLDRLQAKIKGIRGGQSSGTSIISANADAFESYGLKASLIAPTCGSCGERFTKALNDLLSGAQTHLNVAETEFVFWTRKPGSFSFRDFLASPKPEQVRTLIDSARSGKQAPHPDEEAFYAMSLSASGGRTVVRDWIDTTVGEAQHHLAEWFEHQRIVDEWGHEARPLGVYAIAAATERELRDVPATTSRALFRTALTGSPLPPGLLFRAVRRNRAQQGVARVQAALIKLVLLSNERSRQEDAMVELDRENRQPAYRCGRLLAVLEQVQRQALPSAGATIVDRFFGTASSAPASVFGRLLRGSQPHLAKLERDRPGAYYALQKRLEEILAGLDQFPRTFSLEQQGLFALGYYHQRAFDRAEAQKHKELRAGLQGPAEGLDEAEQLNPRHEEES